MSSIASLRIGVDVGGTNTDGVLLDPLSEGTPSEAILAWHKTPTTPDPSQGIETVIRTLLKQAKVKASRIACVSIGTTHFTNAVVEKDRNRLNRVAVIRLCGSFSRDVPPGIDWPNDLRDIICGHCSFAKGGLEIDGSLIDDIDENEIALECQKIKEKGIKAIVINGIFSPADVEHKQEESAAQSIKKHYPEADVVLSRDVANLGFIERENAAILNASILSLARIIINAFQRSMCQAALSCPLFITQNDGTVLEASLAARLPVRTFSSGPTNSMCGAAFLNKNKKQKQTKQSVLVVDIGGTTTDVGMLLPSGLPRQAAAVTELSGIRMNFSYPDVKSIGLGGGSIVRKHGSSALTIGPDSVGAQIRQKSLIFGGNVPTATDYSVASNPLKDIKGATHTSKLSLEETSIAEYKIAVRKMLETIVDRMKTSPEDIPVLLVGGGSILAPDALSGASSVERPAYASVANAIGAAIARVSGTVDMVVNTEGKTTKEVLEKACKLAVEKAIVNGAMENTIEVAEMEAIPLQYIAEKSRLIVKAIGQFNFAASGMNKNTYSVLGEDVEQFERAAIEKLPMIPSDPPSTSTSTSSVDIISYKPKITPQREWIISELDLEWISCGCYILGTGGGGTPYPHFIRVRDMVRKGAVIRVVHPMDLPDDAVVACGGAKGSPTVSVEKLPGNEMMEAQKLVYDQLGYQPTHMIALEIGGGNGLQGMLLGASNNMNVPCVDGDWMGRAYPVAWQITPVVWGGDQAQLLPTAISDGNGNTMIMLSARTEKGIERAFRAALSEMGSYVGCAKGPYSGEKTKKAVVVNTISLAWRIGRAVAQCRAKNDVDHVAEAIIKEVGGAKSAMVLFKGKIVGVERKAVKGHVYGEVMVSATGGETQEEEPKNVGQTLKIPFKNENLAAYLISEDSGGTPEKLLATVPDLISVCDSATGEAIGTPEYRYGLLVFVLGITGSEKWTSTSRGIEIGGPRAFDIDVDYKPLGMFSEPRSVIDEFGL